MGSWLDCGLDPFEFVEESFVTYPQLIRSAFAIAAGRHQYLGDQLTFDTGRCGTRGLFQCEMGAIAIEPSRWRRCFECGKGYCLISYGDEGLNCSLKFR